MCGAINIFRWRYIWLVRPCSSPEIASFAGLRAPDTDPPRAHPATQWARAAVSVTHFLPTGLNLATPFASITRLLCVSSLLSRPTWNGARRVPCSDWPACHEGRRSTVTSLFRLVLKRGSLNVRE